MKIVISTTDGDSKMKCPLCNTVMISPKPLHTFDYNKDGKVLYFCPSENCGYCSCYSEEEEKWVHINQIMNGSVFSNRSRKKAVQHLAHELGLNSLQIQQINDKVRNVSDNLAVKTICKETGLTPFIVLESFFSVRRKRYSFGGFEVYDDE